VSTIDEGTVEDLQDEGEVLERKERRGDADVEEEALEGGEEEGERRGAQVGFLLCLSFRERERGREKGECVRESEKE
jgi:hypothetical protein